MLHIIYINNSTLTTALHARINKVQSRFKNEQGQEQHSIWINLHLKGEAKILVRQHSCMTELRQTATLGGEKHRPFKAIATVHSISLNAGMMADPYFGTPLLMEPGSMHMLEKPWFNYKWEENVC